MILVGIALILIGIAILVLDGRIRKLEINSIDRLDRTVDKGIVSGLESRIKTLEDIHRWGKWHDE